MSVSVEQKNSCKTGCPICSEQLLTPVFEIETVRKYSIVLCQSCQLVFALPRPSTEELDTFYTSEYFKRGSGTSHGLGYADYRISAEPNARRQWQDLNIYTSLAAVTPKKLLDVGCATGGFLAEAQKTGEWNCLGVELSQEAVDVAQNEFGLSVIRGDIWSPSLKPDTFGLITMWHILEHLIHPFDAAKRAHELLAPKGKLFIELPNWNSLGRMIRESSWSQLKPPEHINFFTPYSLRTAVEKAGFEVVKCSTHYPSIMDAAAVRRLTQPLHLGAAIAASPACWLGHGGYLRLLAQKL